jgi:peptidyl-prolyl cis-trans isomerase SurA
MRTVVALGWILIIVFGTIASSEGVLDRVVAVVNNEIITLSEVERGMPPSWEPAEGVDRLNAKQKLYQARRQVLERLIEEKVLDYEAKKVGVRVAETEVDATIEDIKRQNSATQEELEKALAKEGLTFQEYKMQMQKMLMRSRLIRWNVKVEENAGEKELKEFYQTHIERYQRGVSYHLAHILCAAPPGAPPEKILEAKRKAQNVLNRIRRGEDFGEMALRYSEDPSAKERGELGSFKKGEILLAIETEALRLKVGEVSDVIRTDSGFHIIKLLGREGGDPIPFEEVKERVEADYRASQRERAIKAYITSLKAKAVIEIRL